MSTMRTLGASIRAVIQADLRGQVTQHVLVLLSGQLFRLMLGLAGSAILARGLGPAGMSSFAVVGTITAIGIAIADFGLSKSAIRQIAADLAHEPERARRSVATYARLKLLGMACVAGLLVLLAQSIARLLNLPVELGRAWLIAAGCGIVATSLSSVVATVLQALHRFKPLVAAQTINICLSVALLGVLVFSGELRVLTALLVGAAGALAAAILALSRIPVEWRVAIVRGPGLRGPESRQLLTFSWWLWLSAMLSIGAAQLDILMLNRWSTPERTGWYALALNLAFKVDIVNQTVNQVLLPIASTLAGREMYIAYLRRSLSRSVLLFVLLLALMPLLRPFILVVYGPDYAPSVAVFYLLMAAVIVDLVMTPLSLLAYPLGLPRIIAASDASRVVVLIAVGALLIPSWGMYGAALARLASTGCGALVLSVAVITRVRAESRPSAGSHRFPEAADPEPAPPDVT